MKNKIIEQNKILIEKILRIRLGRSPSNGQINQWAEYYTNSKDKLVAYKSIGNDHSLLQYFSNIEKSRPKEDRNINPSFSGKVIKWSLPGRIVNGLPFKIHCIVENYSERSWASENGMHLSYHWYDKLGNIRIFEGARSLIKNSITPHIPSEQTITVSSPSAPGEYILEITLVEEGVSWFEQQGFESATINIKVDACMSSSAETFFNYINNAAI